MKLAVALTALLLTPCGSATGGTACSPPGRACPIPRRSTSRSPPASTAPPGRRTPGPGTAGPTSASAEARGRLPLVDGAVGERVGSPVLLACHVRDDHLGQLGQQL